MRLNSECQHFELQVFFSKKSSRFLSLVIVCFVLIGTAQAMTVFTEEEKEGSGAERYVLIEVAHSSQPAQLATAGCKIIEQYRGFVLAKVPNELVETLSTNHILTLLDDKNELTLSAVGTFNPLVSEPAIPKELRADENNEYYIVQFIGPIKTEWQEELDALGIKVEGYIPNFAYLVRMNAEVKSRVSELRYIQWIGAYHPGYKIAPELNQKTGELAVTVLTHENVNVRNVASKISALDGKILDTSTRARGVLKIKINSERLGDIARLSEVSWLEESNVFYVTNANAQWIIQDNILNTRNIWGPAINKITGEGQVLALSDTGLSTGHNMFRDPAVTISAPGKYPAHRKVIAYNLISGALFGDEAFHGYHGTHVAATLAGDDLPVGGTSANDGMALKAKLSVIDIGREERGLVTPADLGELYQLCYDDGARIISNSWGSAIVDPPNPSDYVNGSHPYDAEAEESDRYMWEHKDFLIFFSNGNHDYDSQTGRWYGRFVGSPACAKNLVSVGGVNNYNQQDSIWSGESIGPTRDLRIKPTVVGIATLTSADGGTTSGDTQMSGTSMASPSIAGNAVLIRQYFYDGWYPTGTKVASNRWDGSTHPVPSAALVKAVLINSADDVAGATGWPNYQEGWGRPDLDNALYFQGETGAKLRQLAVVDNVSLVTGDYVDYNFTLTSSGTPFKVTLVWTDYPGVPQSGTGKILVNNLDLVVYGPGGTYYNGNVFSGGQSRPGGTASDDRNVEEQVLLNSPTPGIYRVRVKATNVPCGPQPFGLVVTGALDLNAGRVMLDKPAYSESDTIKITVEDADATTCTVEVTSTTQSTPVPVTMTQTGSTVWTGSVRTSASPETGKVQVSNGDEIIVKYTDTNPAADRFARAWADVSSPRISGVWVTDISDNAATVAWTTTKPADSKVNYGKTTARGTLKYDATLCINHRVRLTGLDPNTLYYFDLSSSDRFAHSVTDDNSGQYYTFSTIPRAAVLLIDASNQTVDCKQYYKAALDAKGWVYSIWDIKENGGLPPLSTMQQYYVNIWDTGENYPQCGDFARPLIKNYIDRGGRLFITSHDVAWDQDSYGTPSQTAHVSYASRLWFRSVLKAHWKDDPPESRGLRGIAGDPISGGWTGTVSYKELRSGGAGDFVTKLNIGGTTDYVWRMQNGTSGVNFDYAAIRWVSSANNGTSSDGVWGQKPSRIVAYFFIWWQINPGVINDPTRTAILNKTLVWLLEGDHPWVKLLAPRTGDIWSGTQTITWTATGAATYDVYYSPNGGQAWFPVPGAQGITQTSIQWNLGSLPLGNTYRVKVIGKASNGLIGSDMSGNFTISGEPMLAVTVNVDDNSILSYGQANITVHVTNSTSGLAVEGASVSLTVTNGVCSPTSGTTDNAGNFNSVFTAPRVNSPTTCTVTAQATKPGYLPSSGYADITVNPPAIPPRLNVMVNADRTIILSYDQANLTVRVTNSTSGLAVEGASVSLTVTNGVCSPSSGTTDSAGNFNSVFTAPRVSSLTTCRVTVQATKSGYISGSGELNITVQPYSPHTLTAFVTADKTSILSYGQSNITVHVVDETNTVVHDADVTFTVTDGMCSPSSGTTDANGDLMTVFTAPRVETSTLCRITAEVSKPNYNPDTRYIEITVNPPQPHTLIATINADRTAVLSYGQSNITVHVVNETNVAVQGADICISVTNGGSCTPATGVTDADGNFRTIFTAPHVSTQTICRVVVDVSMPGHNPDSKYIEITVAYGVSLTGTLKVIVKDTDNRPISNATITVKRGTVVVTTGVTSDSGEWIVQLEPGTYNITVSANGYEDKTRETEVIAGTVTTISITLTKKVVGPGFELLPFIAAGALTAAVFLRRRRKK